MSVTQFCGTVLSAVLYMAVPVTTLAASYSTGSIDGDRSQFSYNHPLIYHILHSRTDQNFCVIYLDYGCQHV